MKNHSVGTNKRIGSLIIAVLLASGFSSSQANAAELKAEQANVSEISESIGNNVQNMENIQQIEQTNSTDDGDVLPEIESDLGEEETSETEPVDISNIQGETEKEEAPIDIEEDSTININKPTDLKWNPDRPGSFSFYNNNEDGVRNVVHVFESEMMRCSFYSSNNQGQSIYEGDVSHMLHDSGDYIFRVYLYANEEDYLNDKVAVISDDSDVFHYVKPELKIEAPKNVRWDSANPGTVVWDFVDHAEEYLVEISDNGFQTVIMRGSCKYDVPQANLSDLITAGHTYEVRVKAYSENINLYSHSDYSAPDSFHFAGENDNISGTDNTQNDVQNIVSDNGSGTKGSDGENVPYIWEPATEEEKVRYSCLGKEKAQYTVAGNQPFDINVQNAMQGEKCFEVFQNAAGAYTIARTYNIYPLGSMTKYSTDEKVTVSLTIPEILRKEKREFKMVCVTQNVIPIIFNDQDKNPDTVTFSTDKFYAFALVYRDLK